MDFNSYFSYLAFFRQSEDLLLFITDEEEYYDSDIFFSFSFNRVNDEIFILDKSNFFGDNILIPVKPQFNAADGEADSLELLDTTNKFFYRVSKKINKTVYPRTGHNVSGSIRRIIKDS